MKTEWIIPPPGSPEAIINLQLTYSELVALIHRCVPEDTWTAVYSERVVNMTFPRGPLQASRVADQITDGLIRAHDKMNDPSWRQRTDGQDARIDRRDHRG